MYYYLLLYKVLMKIGESEEQIAARLKKLDPEMLGLWEKQNTEERRDRSNKR